MLKILYKSKSIKNNNNNINLNNKMNSLPLNFEEFLNGPAIILSLPEYKDTRYEYTKKKLNDVGFTNINYFQGIHGYNDDINKISNELNINFTSEVKTLKGCIGCLLSSIQIWKKIVDEDLPYLIIFEDDALPEPEFKTMAKEWYDETPKQLHALYLGSQFYDDKYNGIKVVSSPCFCTHAYVLTNAGAKRFLELSLNNNNLDRVDCEMMRWQNEKLIVWYNWNNIGIYNKSFPNNIPNIDSIFTPRDNGLIYQNYKFESAIQNINNKS